MARCEVDGEWSLHIVHGVPVDGFNGGPFYSVEKERDGAPGEMCPRRWKADLAETVP